MLTTAQAKFLNPNPQSRLESLEKLWDAWERLKTIELPDSKDKTTRILFAKVSIEPNFQQLLEEESRKLTKIGNDFMIRHSEVTKTPIQSSDQADYLFQRMFAMIHLLLKARGNIKTGIVREEDILF